MNIRPLFDKVVIKPLENEEKTTNFGFVLRSNDQEKPTIATVVAVGDGGLMDGKNVEMKVKVGDKVIFPKYSGNEFHYNNEDYIIIKQSDILALID